MNLPVITPVPQGIERPFWSIMIPAFNPRADYLRETLEHVRRAGLPPGRFECVVVDQSDPACGVADWIRDFHDIPVGYHRNDQTKGMVPNWNYALRLARGEWVHLLHSDDRVQPGFYQAVEDGIKAAPNVGAAFTQMNFIDDDGRYIRTGHCTQAGAGVLHDWVEHCFVNMVIQCPSIVVRRAVYERMGGFDPGYCYCVDVEMWQRIALEYPVWFDPRPLAEYRLHRASTTEAIPLPDRLREQRRWFLEGVQRLSPVIRNHARAHGTIYQFRWKWNEVLGAVKALRGQPVKQARLLFAFLRLFDWRDWKAIWRWRKRWPHPLPSRAPERGLDPMSSRRKRILLVSEFFPGTGEAGGRAVTGAFLRLRRNLAGLRRKGFLDAAFFWPNNASFTGQDLAWIRQNVDPAWQPDGVLALISRTVGPLADLHQRPLQTVFWFLRGVGTCYGIHPNQSSCGYRQAAQLRDVLLRTQPDLIFAHRVGARAALFRARLPLPPVWLDQEDVEHIRLKRFCHSEPSVAKRVKGSVAARMAKHLERLAVKRSHLTTVCSGHDREAYQRLSRRDLDIRLLPNTVPGNKTPLADSAQPVLLFVGYAAYKPNQDAIRWLVCDIWPRIRTAVPDAAIHVVGEQSRKWANHDPAQGVHVWDFVEDLTPHYARAALTVCPIRAGSGTRIKILEAALYQRAMVSTSLGAEGLDFEPDREIVLADTEAAFADACIDLLQFPEKRHKVARAARTRAERDYTDEAALRLLGNWLDEVMDRNEQ